MTRKALFAMPSLCRTWLEFPPLPPEPSIGLDRKWQDLTGKLIFTYGGLHRGSLSSPLVLVPESIVHNALTLLNSVGIPGSASGALRRIRPKMAGFDRKIDFLTYGGSHRGSLSPLHPCSATRLPVTEPCAPVQGLSIVPSPSRGRVRVGVRFSQEAALADYCWPH